MGQFIQVYFYSCKDLLHFLIEYHVIYICNVSLQLLEDCHIYQEVV